VRAGYAKFGAAVLPLCSFGGRWLTGAEVGGWEEYRVWSNAPLSVDEVREFEAIDLMVQVDWALADVKGRWRPCLGPAVLTCIPIRRDVTHTRFKTCYY
jgi:hypothetical protein